MLFRSDTGAHYVLLVEKAGEADLLIPFIRQNIVEIDQQNERIRVKLPDGLYELYRRSDK